MDAQGVEGDSPRIDRFKVAQKIRNAVSNLLRRLSEEPIPEKPHKGEQDEQATHMG